MSTITNIEEVYNKYKEKFIEDRSRTETDINNYMNNISKWPPELLEKINPPQGKTAREIMPSMWVVPFDEDQYKKEREDFMAFASRAKALADQYNEETLRWLSR